jgi:hypothetical protein
MSLAARIAIAPSRGLALAEAAMLVGAFVLVGVTLAIRVLPDDFVSILAMTMIAATGVARRRFAARIGQPVRVVVTSDRAEVEVVTVGESGHADLWRVRASTLAWPGFSVVSLEPVDRTMGRRLLDLPAVHSELAPRDAWALSRFLRWMSA